MTHTFDELQQARVLLGRPGLAGTGILQAEKIDLQTRLAAQEAHGIADHHGVNITNPQPNQALMLDANGDWVNRSPGGSTVWAEQVQPGGSQIDTVHEAATRLAFYQGLTAASQSGFAERVLVSVRFGGPGQKTTVSREDHWHGVLPNLRFDYAGSGVPLSSGSRSLVNQEVGGFEVDLPMVITLRGYVHVQGVDDLARFNIVLGIGGQTSTSGNVGGPDPYVAEWGVNGQWAWEYSRLITRTASGAESPATRAVTMDVQRVSGSLDIISGYLVVERRPGR